MKKAAGLACAHVMHVYMLRGASLTDKLYKHTSNAQPFQRRYCFSKNWRKICSYIEFGFGLN